MSEKKCSDCGVGLEIGYVPEFVHGGAIRSRWYRGVTEKSKFLGLEVGGGTIRVPPIGGIPVRAYRCPECGVLKFYAEKGE